MSYERCHGCSLFTHYCYYKVYDTCVHTMVFNATGSPAIYSITPVKL